MNTAEALRSLQEIAPPPPVSYFPQTGGWLVLLGLLLLVLTVWLWRRWRRYQSNRYRREARAELDGLQSRLGEPEHYASSLAALPALIKRTTLGFAPRAQVAALSGEDWLRFLDATLAAKTKTKTAVSADIGENAPDTPFQRGAGRLLWSCAYRDAAFLRAIPRDDSEALCALLRRWINDHVPV